MKIRIVNRREKVRGLFTPPDGLEYDQGGSLELDVKDDESVHSLAVNMGVLPDGDGEAQYVTVFAVLTSD